LARGAERVGKPYLVSASAARCSIAWGADIFAGDLERLSMSFLILRRRRLALEILAYR
jgi:hypothetical protein